MFRSAKSASWLPILSNSALIALKLGVGLVIGSISVVSDALDTSIDVLSAFVVFVSIRIASRPAHREHPYGHGKAENLSGVVESFFILAGGTFITFEAVRRIITPSEISFIELGIGVMALSIVVNLAVSWHLAAVARRTESPALDAAAKHRATDVLTSLGILLGLLIVRLTGFTRLDPILAIGVAAILFWTALRIIRSSFNALMDVRLPVEEEHRVFDLTARYNETARLEQMRTRRAGTQRHFDITLTTCQHLSVGVAHHLTDHLEEDILRAFPGSVISVHVEPCTQEEGATCPLTCPVNGRIESAEPQ